MARQFFITPLICADDGGLRHCTPDMPKDGVGYVATCQDPDVPNPLCMVLVTGDTTAANNDSKLVSLVTDNFDTPIASLSNAIRNRINNGLTSKTIPLDVNDYTLVRDFLNELGKWFDPNFALENFWVIGN